MSLFWRLMLSTMLTFIDETAREKQEIVVLDYIACFFCRLCFWVTTNRFGQLWHVPVWRSLAWRSPSLNDIWPRHWCWTHSIEWYCKRINDYKDCNITNIIKHKKNNNIKLFFVFCSTRVSVSSLHKNFMEVNWLLELSKEPAFCLTKITAQLQSYSVMLKEKRSA